MKGYVVTITSVEKRSKDFHISADSEDQAKEIATHIIDMHGTSTWKVSAVKNFHITASRK